MWPREKAMEQARGEICRSLSGSLDAVEIFSSIPISDGWFLSRVSVEFTVVSHEFARPSGSRASVGLRLLCSAAAAGYRIFKRRVIF